MKKYIYSFIFLLGLFATAQNSNNQLVNNTAIMDNASKATQSSYGSMLTVYNPARQVEGSVYLFDDWENLGALYTTDNRKLLINNINLNVKSNTFESKIVKDSLFVFGFNNIDKFEVNNKIYKNFYWDGDNKVYQILYDSNDFKVIKGFNLRFIEGSANPMLNRTRDKYVIKDSYYIKYPNKIELFRLKKGKIFKLINATSEEKKKINDYVDDNNLSFKDEQDIGAILTYAMGLRS